MGFEARGAAARTVFSFGGDPKGESERVSSGGCGDGWGRGRRGVGLLDWGRVTFRRRGTTAGLGRVREYPYPTSEGVG